MEILQNILYVGFFIQVFRWILTMIMVANHPFRGALNIPVSFIDNILWIAPVVYFSGGLV